MNDTPRRHTDSRTGQEIIDFTYCISGRETPEQVKLILMGDESRRLKERRKAGRLLRAKSRLDEGYLPATMFYYDRFGRYHGLGNTLTTVLTSENRDIMQERMGDERIPEWRRETIKWGLEQGDMIRKCAKDLKTVAEDGATGDKSRDNLAARFNDELVPRSWNHSAIYLIRQAAQARPLN